MNLTNAISTELGLIHFIGIGGIGMSGMAEILHNLGYMVQGSDSGNNANVERLKSFDIPVFIGHESDNIENAALVVRSTAIKDDNIEMQAARNANIPIISRADMLSEIVRLKPAIAIAGTHGKTTTTSLVAMMLENAGKDPTVINGGIINRKGTNAYLGKGDCLVVEADESDGTFLKLPAQIAVITNIDPEHLDYWHNFENIQKAFRDFIANLPFYGLAVICNDHPESRKLALEINDRKIITYAIDNEANIMAINIKSDISGSNFDIKIGNRIIKNIFLPTPGRHNVLNSLAALAIAVELGLDEDKIRNSFLGFQGVKRRFTKTGEVDNITIIDDYGHHPAEIAATLATAHSIKNGGRVIAIFQPHRYSRISSLMNEFAECFGDADMVIVTDIYAAGEAPISGIDKHEIASAIRNNGKEAIALSGDLAEQVYITAKSGDIVVCLGAGTITYMANELPAKLQSLRNTNAA